jgi:hypothetical protein
MLLTLSKSNLFSQAKLSTLLGKWKVTRFEYVDSSDNEKLKLEQESYGTIVSFEKGGKFTTQKKEKDLMKLVSTGNFSISKDNKYLYQDDKESVIVKLTDTTLELKINDDLIIHFAKTY